MNENSVCFKWFTDSLPEKNSQKSMFIVFLQRNIYLDAGVLNFSLIRLFSSLLDVFCCENVS